MILGDWDMMRRALYLSGPGHGADRQASQDGPADGQPFHCGPDRPTGKATPQQPSFDARTRAGRPGTTKGQGA